MSTAGSGHLERRSAAGATRAAGDSLGHAKREHPDQEGHQRQMAGLSCSSHAGTSPVIGVGRYLNSQEVTSEAQALLLMPGITMLRVPSSPMASMAPALAAMSERANSAE